MTEARSRSTADEALARIETHEEVCTVRYEAILSRVDRLERVIIVAAGSVILGLMSLTATLLTFFWHLSAGGHA